MTRLLWAGFLLAHGLIHPAIYAIPKDPTKPAPFDPSHSWALTSAHVAEHPARTLGVAMAGLTAVLYAAAGVVLLGDSSPWMPLAVCAAVTGLLLKGLYFHPWLAIGVLIDVGVLWAAIAGWPPSLV